MGFCTLYVLRTGCQWHLLPHDLPPYKTVYVYDYYRQWRRRGLWERINTTLRECSRHALKRNAQPSAAIIDGQTVKTTEKGGHAVTRLRWRQEGEWTQTPPAG